MKGFRVLAPVAGMLLLTAGLVLAKQPQHFATFTGSSISTAFDSDVGTPGDQIALGREVELSGNGKVLGKFTAKGLSNLAPLPQFPEPLFECNGGQFQPGVSTEILLHYASFQFIFTSASGDQLHTAMSSDGGTLCFSLSGEPGVVTVHLDIVGGTGRLEDTEGELVFHAMANAVGIPGGLAYMNGTIEED